MQEKWTENKLLKVTSQVWFVDLSERLHGKNLHHIHYRPGHLKPKLLEKCNLLCGSYMKRVGKGQRTREKREEKHFT